MPNDDPDAHSEAAQHDAAAVPPAEPPVVEPAAAEQDPSEPTTFDFARPGRLTRERARLVQQALDEVARQSEDALRLWVDGVRVEAGDVEQRTVGDLVAGPVDYVVLSLPERGERALVLSELPLAVSLVLALLGGSPEVGGELRPLTPLETEVLDLVLSRMVSFVGSVLMLGPIDLEVHGTDPAAVNFVDERELMLCIPFIVRTDVFSGRLWVVLSSGSFQPFTLEQERRQAGRLPAGRPVDRRRNEVLLQRVTVPVVCGFPPVRVPARDLASLRPGDVLRTGQPTTRDLQFRVGGSPLFGARVGQRGMRLVGEVISVLGPAHPNSWSGGMS